MADSGIRTRHLRIPNRGDIRYMYYTRDDFADLNSARHGQFQK